MGQEGGVTFADRDAKHAVWVCVGLELSLACNAGINEDKEYKQKRKEANKDEQKTENWKQKAGISSNR